jgi:hypothetical protein
MGWPGKGGDHKYRNLRIRALPKINDDTRFSPQIAIVVAKTPSRIAAN